MTTRQSGVYTQRTPRIAAARKLTTRAERDRTGHFLAEGAQAVAEALRRPQRVRELFVTAPAAQRHPDLVQQATDGGVAVAEVTGRAAEMLSETVTPQGIVAVCRQVDVTLDEALAGAPRLVVVLCGVSDPGNAGTVLRVADAAGAAAVIFAGDTVDPHNGKCVRASTGSLFHVRVARTKDVDAAFAACRHAGLRVVGADGNATADVFSSDAMAERTAWAFGNEAHGLPDAVTAACDEVLRVPIYGDAESLNLGTAAAVCLYVSARAHR